VEPGTPILEKLPQLGWNELYRDEISVVYAK
jgi:hypothetical protein